jgi:hypothetical protein
VVNLLKHTSHPSYRARPASGRFAMLGAVLRGVGGFIVACFAAGAAMVGFVTTPAEIAGGDPNTLAAAGVLTLLTAIDSARFAALFALIAASIGEWGSIRGWIYYAAAGIAIAITGFMVQYANAAGGQPALVDNYALTAFLTAGLVGGSVYWLFAGRRAGHPGNRRTGPKSTLEAGQHGPTG